MFAYYARKGVKAAVSAYARDWLKGEIISAQKTKMPAATATTVTANNSATSNAPTASPSPQNDSAGKVVQPKKGLMVN